MEYLSGGFGAESRFEIQLWSGGMVARYWWRLMRDDICFVHMEGILWFIGLKTTQLVAKSPLRRQSTDVIHCSDSQRSRRLWQFRNNCSIFALGYELRCHPYVLLRLGSLISLWFFIPDMFPELIADKCATISWPSWQANKDGLIPTNDKVIHRD